MVHFYAQCCAKKYFLQFQSSYKSLTSVNTISIPHSGLVIYCSVEKAFRLFYYTE